jgi:hypothetical protein
MSPTIYLLTLGLPLATCLLIFGMRYLSAVLQARARLANDEAYRQLAEKSAAAQAAAAAALASIDATLADVRLRLASVEKVLKEVE